MIGGANAEAAAAASGGSGICDRARMSKVHDELWARSDAAKLFIDSVTRRTKDLSTLQLTGAQVCPAAVPFRQWRNGTGGEQTSSHMPRDGTGRRAHLVHLSDHDRYTGTVRECARCGRQDSVILRRICSCGCGCCYGA